MPDTLSAMREFRFLEDKRNGGGLSQAEEGRWQELHTQLEQVTPAAPSVDPVVYAQELIAQGHDPVQAFLHVGFSLEQIAASGYDVTAYLQAQTEQSVDPHAYAASLIAQGYDAVTAYTAAGLPVPQEGVAAPAEALVAAPEQHAANHEHHDLAFADAELIEEVPAVSVPDDGTAGWIAESRGELPPVSPMTRPELEVWRTPAKPAVALPEPGPLPRVDTHVPDPQPPAGWELPPAVAHEAVAVTAELAASAVVAEGVSSPFEPTLPEPLPPGVAPEVETEAAPVEAPVELTEIKGRREIELPVEDAPLPELLVVGSPDALAAQVVDAREMEFDGGADSALPELELGSPGLEPASDSPSSAEQAALPVDAREMEFAGGADDPLPELDTERTGLVADPLAEAQPAVALGDELELPALERHESEWNLGAEENVASEISSGEFAAPPEVEAQPELAPAPAPAEVAPEWLASTPEPEAPVAEPAPAISRPDTGLLPVLDAAELSAEVIQEGTPTRMMTALSVEFLASRTAVAAEPDWASDSTSEEIPAPAPEELAPEPEPLAAAPEPAPIADEWALPAEPAPLAPEPEPLAPEPAPLPELSADAFGLEEVPAPELAPIEAPAPELAAVEPAAAAPGAVADQAWPTAAELSDWNSADKGEYAAWSTSAGGVQVYPDVSEAALAEALGVTPAPAPELAPPEPIAEPALEAPPVEAPASSDLFAAPGAWQETAAPEWESIPAAHTPSAPALEAAIAPAAPLEATADEWGAPPPPSAAALPTFAIPAPQLHAAPAEWGEEEPPQGDLVLEAGELIEESPVEPAASFAMPPPSIRTGKVRPPSEPPPAPAVKPSAPLQVVIPPAVTRKPSVVVDQAGLAPVPPPPARPALDVTPARVAPSVARGPSMIIDQALLSEDPPMAVDDSAFTPSQGTPSHTSAASLRLAGERKVIVHMIDGSVRRGAFRDADLGAASLALESQTGVVENIARDRMKAIFFMLATGTPASSIEGSKLRVTFTDGRNLVGFSSTYDPGAVGFFIVPADARTNTERVFVYRAAIRGVANG